MCFWQSVSSRFDDYLYWCVLFYWQKSVFRFRTPNSRVAHEVYPIVFLNDFRYSILMSLVDHCDCTWFVLMCVYWCLFFTAGIRKTMHFWMYIVLCTIEAPRYSNHRDHTNFSHTPSIDPGRSRRVAEWVEVGWGWVMVGILITQARARQWFKDLI